MENIESIVCPVNLHYLIHILECGYIKPENSFFKDGQLYSNQINCYVTFIGEKNINSRDEILIVLDKNILKWRSDCLLDGHIMGKKGICKVPNSINNKLKQIYLSSYPNPNTLTFKNDISVRKYVKGVVFTLGNKKNKIGYNIFINEIEKNMSKLFKSRTISDDIFSRLYNEFYFIAKGLLEYLDIRYTIITLKNNEYFDSNKIYYS